MQYLSLLHIGVSVVEARVGRPGYRHGARQWLVPQAGLVGGVLVIKCEFDSRALLGLPQPCIAYIDVVVLVVLIPIEKVMAPAIRTIIGVHSQVGRQPGCQTGRAIEAEYARIVIAVAD